MRSSERTRLTKVVATVGVVALMAACQSGGEQDVAEASPSTPPETSTESEAPATASPEPAVPAIETSPSEPLPAQEPTESQPPAPAVAAGESWDEYGCPSTEFVSATLGLPEPWQPAEVQETATFAFANFYCGYDPVEGSPDNWVKYIIAFDEGVSDEELAELPSLLASSDRPIATGDITVLYEQSNGDYVFNGHGQRLSFRPSYGLGADSKTDEQVLALLSEIATWDWSYE